ncbi:pyruvate dehydrogenase (acetyl-transferring) E1 component subunit alpha [Georgenia alba]|uniref:Pyruvate dehydrogenase (Acetyl-transferring) E1 component subunit alpha n=1 Tax=Georgenia alba TaxID=2233858 RepID=A0ABW2Q3U1_9MICO
MTDPLTLTDAAPSTIQLLDQEGRRHRHPELTPALDALGEDAVRAMYRDMVLTRAFDTQATSLQRQGELGLWAQSLGQEAAQVGSGHALAARDYVFPSYREHGVAQVRGLDLRELLALFRGTRHGGWDPKAHNFHLYSIVIATQALHAVGYAMGIQRDGDVGTGNPARDRAVVCYLGDGATSQGDANEGMVFAASANAPVVFFVQNNQWAISVPSSTQSRVPLAMRGGGFGIPSLRVDGNDPLACYAATRIALERARSGGGPTLIEAVTYRMGAHTTSDDPSRYRTREEEESWARKDPIRRVRACLEREGRAEEDFFSAVEHEADELAAATRDHCRSLRVGPPTEMFDHVYATPHPLVAGERADFVALEESFADDAGAAS